MASSLSTRSSWRAVLAGTSADTVAVGAETGTTFESLAEPQDVVTVTPRVTDPEAGAVNWIDDAPCPEVMAPALIVQLYVALAVGLTEAVLAVELAQTSGRAVIAAEMLQVCHPVNLTLAGLVMLLGSGA